MGSKSRRENSSLSKLLKYPQVFDFFQAVRLLQTQITGVEGERDNANIDENFRFHASNVQRFPSSEIEQVSAKYENIVDIFVSFFGVNGTSGVLPAHYTELIVQRLRQKDTTLQDFFDIFNHRAIALFYRAWAKYRIYANTRNITTILSSLIGIGSKELQNRLVVPDETLLFYSGLMRQPHSASALESMLSDYFGLPITIEQFRGEWRYLKDEDRSRMGVFMRKTCENTYNILGVNFVLGQRVWNLQNRFRIRVGLVSYSDYKELLPSGRMLKYLYSLTRYYVGIEFNFDVQVVLRSSEVPHCQLGYSTTQVQNPCYLGWNTWLYNKPLHVEVDDLVLSGYQQKILASIC